MPPRFCAECGAKRLPDAKFCPECGTPLRAGAAPRGEGGWRLTGIGAGAVGAFLITGLAIWTVILSPAPPRPAPGATAPRGAAPANGGATTPGQVAGGGRAAPHELPAEVKTFIADLGAKAREKPEDLSAWVKLALVNARAAQLDPAYYPDALAAFRHVLARDPKHPEALRGMANLHYEREEPKEAIPFFEQYLAIRPDDVSARTDLGTMYLSADDASRAIAAYQEVIRRSPSLLQAHYNLALAHHRQGDTTAALRELETARGLATDEGVRTQIDEQIAALRDGGTRPPAPGGSERTPFQAAVEEAFRAHPIMGPRIVRFDWTAPGAGRVLMRDFPMEGMPPAVREKFAARLAEAMRSAQSTHRVEGGEVRVEIADVVTGRVMATVGP
jgi:tetratricopeptide (TPR) repeat protein